MWDTALKSLFDVETKRVVPNLSHLRNCPFMRHTSVI